MTEYARLRCICASPEIYRLGLALNGSYAALLRRKSAATCTSQELRRALAADLRGLLLALERPK